MTNKTEKIKYLVERYPFLLPKNVFSDKIPEDYDYSYIKHLEIPKGWFRLFLQLCEDIRQPLIDAGCLDTFRFTQVKEKYNQLRCYHTGAPEVVNDILLKYEQMAYYVCTDCGKPAKHETQVYFASFCDECLKKLVKQGYTEPIKFKDCFEVTKYLNKIAQTGELEEITYIVSFKDEWLRYIKSLETDFLYTKIL